MVDKETLKKTIEQYKKETGRTNRFICAHVNVKPSHLSRFLKGDCGIGAFMFEVQELDTLTEFDEKLWLTIIDTVTVHADGRMTFKFQGGTEIEG